MTKRNILILDLLLTACIIYFTYNYFGGNVIIKERQYNETEFHTKVQNPLTIIFIGRETHENTRSYTEYNVISRMDYFVKLAFWLLLILGVARYYWSGRKRISILLFGLMANFVILISVFVYLPFYIIYDWLNPGNAINLYFALSLKRILINVSVLVTLFFLIKKLKSGIPVLNYADSEYKFRNIRWMRGFHYLADRLIILVFGFNVFLNLYFSVKYKTGYPVNISSTALFNWGSVSFSAAVLFCYFLLEGLFHITPGKILTGTYVIGNGSSKTASWKDILKRTLSRAIPFEFLSFFSIQNGWHDRFSNTALTYIQSEKWLIRQTRIIKWVFGFYLFFAAWFSVTSFLQIRQDYDSIYEQVASLPFLLVLVTLPFVIILFICWIASISNYSENISSKKFEERSGHFGAALTWWIPFFHFFYPSETLSNVNDDFLKMAPLNPFINKIKSHSKIFTRLFGLFYTLLILGILLNTLAQYRVEAAIAMSLSSLALIIWSISVLIYSRHLQRFINNV